MAQRPRRRTAQLFQLRRELATGQLRIDAFKLADALLRREPQVLGLPQALPYRAKAAAGN